MFAEKTGYGETPSSTNVLSAHETDFFLKRIKIRWKKYSNFAKKTRHPILHCHNCFDKHLLFYAKFIY